MYLEDCPFCGSSSVEIREHEDEYDIFTLVECRQCHAKGPRVISRNCPDVSARQKWNERAVKAVQQ